MSAFSPEFQSGLADPMRWRRDVRHFRAGAVDEAVLTRCLDAFVTAPSESLIPELETAGWEAHAPSLHLDGR